MPLMVKLVLDLVERDLVEQELEVGKGVDRDADPADLLLDVGVVGVVATLRRQVERYRQAGAALREQVAVALVGLLRSAETGVLPEGPEPALIAGREVAASERELARRRKIVGGRQVLRPVARL